tara:strand:- start:1066 stop:1227 length:162 start_codon:yes stop_codon:yes gene_type:complete
MFILYIPLALLGKWLIGVTGIFIAAAASNLIMGLIAYNWNRQTYRIAAIQSTS